MIAQGVKTIEYRTWSTKHRGRFLIVSSLKPALPGNYAGRLGTAICSADLYKVSASLDTPGLFLWHLRNIKPVKPVKIKGGLKFYTVEPDKIIEI